MALFYEWPKLWRETKLDSINSIYKIAIRPKSSIVCTFERDEITHTDCREYFCCWSRSPHTISFKLVLAICNRAKSKFALKMLCTNAQRPVHLSFAATNRANIRFMKQTKNIKSDGIINSAISTHLKCCIFINVHKIPWLCVVFIMQKTTTILNPMLSHSDRSERRVVLCSAVPCRALHWRWWGAWKTPNCIQLVILWWEHFRFACSLLDMHNNNIICWHG